MKTKTNIPSAGSLMNRNVQTVTPELSLIELVDFLQGHRISCVTVVEDQKSKPRLIGFVSESDALKHLSNEMFYGLSEPQPAVKTCMKRHPISIMEDVDLFAVASLLVNHGYRHVPVVDEDNQLLGIVSRRDVLKAMRSYYVKSTREHDAEYFPPDLTKIINHRFILSRQD